MKYYELLYEIQKLQFAAVELNLFLDTHPNNKEAKEDYKKVSKILDKLTCEYEENFGPLKNFGKAYKENPMKWTSQPWPWENC